jgi:hypothetical protein
MNESSLRSCALCSKRLDPGKQVGICDDCIKFADCCVGLERISE